MPILHSSVVHPTDLVKKSVSLRGLVLLDARRDTVTHRATKVFHIIFIFYTYQIGCAFYGEDLLNAPQILECYILLKLCFDELITKPYCNAMCCWAARLNLRYEFFAAG